MQKINGYIFSDDFLRETVEVWQPLNSTPLTMADCHEIADSMISLFSALARCAKEAGIPRNKTVPAGNPDDRR